ncbi:MAG: hypothetical protein AAF745_13195 [Planctomycetota bacterium]
MFLTLRQFALGLFFVASPLVSANAVDVQENAVGTSDSVVTGFERHVFTVVRSRGQTFVAGQAITPRDAVAGYQPVEVIERLDGLEFKSALDFSRWARKLIGPRHYTFDTVHFEDADGNKATVPLVLLPAEQRNELDARWREWLQTLTKTNNSSADKSASSMTPITVAQTATQRPPVQHILVQSSQPRTEETLWAVTLQPNTPLFGNSVYFTTNDFFQLSPSAPNNRFFTVHERGFDSQAATARVQAKYPGYAVARVRAIGGFF